MFAMSPIIRLNCHPVDTGAKVLVARNLISNLKYFFIRSNIFITIIIISNQR